MVSCTQKKRQEIPTNQYGNKYQLSNNQGHKSATICQ